ncbi:hypothetical protein B0I37DRAFT_384678 [Chaetomium sp. MPI-CAGE-AT-0009]|nr:hypothetical protein B0I37DRAFT_384678 [Chaetomium sp. MPI-CAGE-AT-0009]
MRGIRLVTAAATLEALWLLSAFSCRGRSLSSPLTTARRRWMTWCCEASIHSFTCGPLLRPRCAPSTALPAPTTNMHPPEAQLFESQVAVGCVSVFDVGLALG